MEQLCAVSDVVSLDEHNGEKGNFIKTFLINTDVNYNGWQVTAESIEKRRKEWIGKPGVEYTTYKRTHPEYDDYDIGLQDQEQYRKSTIIDVYKDERTGNDVAVSEVHDDELYEQIKSGEVRYISPSIFPLKFENTGYPLLASDFKPFHYAFVDEPAYGPIAKIAGVCSDGEDTCKKHLAPLVADIDSENVSHVRTVPLIESISTLVSKETRLNQDMTDEGGKKLEKLEAMLKAQQEDIDKLKDQKSGTDDDGKKQENANDYDDNSNKDQKSGTDDDGKKQEKANEEDINKLKQENAMLQASLKKHPIESILSASRQREATPDQLSAQKRFLEKLQLSELEEYQSNFILKADVQQQQYNTTTEIPNIPDISRIGINLIADEDSIDNGSDDELLRSGGFI